MRRYFWALRIAAGVLGFVASCPSQDDLAQLYLAAKKAQVAGDLATASQKYEAIVRLRPDMAEAHANLGNIYYQQGKPDRAKASYQKAVQIKPDLAGPYFFLGVIAFGEHDLSPALRFLQRAAALENSNPLIYSYLGYTYYARSDFRDAADALEKAAALQAADIDVLYHLSKSYSHLAKDAVDHLQRSFPESKYFFLVRAHAFESAENWKDAGEQYSLALQTMQGNARLQRKVQWIAAKTANGNPSVDTGAADELIDGSLAYKDSQVSGEKLKAEITRWQSKVRAVREPKTDQQLYFAGEGYQVLAYLTSLAVFESDPDSYRAHQLRAQLLETSSKDEEAIAEYRDVLKRKPDLQNIHFVIGSIYWKGLRFDEAKGELQKELRLNPNHPQALYEMGDIAVYGGDPKAGEKYFLGALKLDATIIEAHLALEKIYTQDGQYQKSLEHLRKALELDSSDATLHYRLAAVYRKLGNTQEAEKELAIFQQKQRAAKR